MLDVGLLVDLSPVPRTAQTISSTNLHKTASFVLMRVLKCTQSDLTELN